MKPLLPIGIVVMMFLLSSCAIVGGIFKAGVWTGILIVVFIVGVILWLITKGSGKS